MFLTPDAIHILDKVTVTGIAALVAVNDDTDIVDGEHGVTGDAIHGGGGWG